jgi:hypothetical protein
MCKDAKIPDIFIHLKNALSAIILTLGESLAAILSALCSGGVSQDHHCPGQVVGPQPIGLPSPGAHPGKAVSCLRWLKFRLPDEIELINQKTIGVRTIFLFSLMLVFSFLNVSAQEAKDSGAIEPKNRFELIINGKTYQAVEGQPLTLDSTVSKPSISIKLSDRKQFAAASFFFDYPRHLSFEYEKDTGLQTWTLSGNSLVVMLFELDGQIPLNALIESMVKKFGHQLTNGERLHVKLAGTNLIIDFYALVSRDAKSRIISFQDTIKDNGDSSDEFNAGFQMINSSIRFL